jgi:DNA-directed RNA polymerase specialized sigma24 family protein
MAETPYPTQSENWIFRFFSKVVEASAVCTSNVMTPPPATDLRGLLDRYERPLIRYAQSIVGDLESARDVVQDTFIRYVRITAGEVEADDSMHATPDIPGDGQVATQAPPPALDASNTKHVEAWLFTVTRNRALDYIRKHSRIIAMPLAEERESPEMAPDEMLASRDAAEWLLKLLDALTPNQREVIRLKFQNDLSYQEISDITGLSVTNVGFLLHVGLKKLRSILREAPLDAIPVRLRTAL